MYHGVLKFESDKLCAETRRNKYSIFSPIGVCRLENKRHPNNPAFESRLVTYNYQFTFRMCSRKNVWIVVLEMSQSQDLKKHLQAKSKLQTTKQFAFVDPIIYDAMYKLRINLIDR